jgi:hypothetical protein
VDVGVGIDADAGGDAVDAACRAELEGGGERGGILVDQQRQPPHRRRTGSLRQQVQRQRHERRVLGAIGHIERDHAGTVADLPVVEHLGCQRRPRIILRRPRPPRQQQRQRRAAERLPSCPHDRPPGRGLV